MVACGQTIAHLLHWIQRTSSQTGISAAMLRFSQRVVLVGNVPSTGNADTGSRSPLPAIITAVTLRTKSGAVSGTMGGREKGEVTCTGQGTSGWFTSCWSMEP